MEEQENEEKENLKMFESTGSFTLGPAIQPIDESDRGSKEQDYEINKSVRSVDDNFNYGT